MKWLDFFGALIVAAAIGTGLYKMAAVFVRGLRTDSKPEKPEEGPDADAKQ